MIASPYSVELQIASLLSVSGMCMLFMCLWYASSGVYHCCSSGERSASVVHGSLSAVTWPPACCVQSPIPALWTVRALGECKSWLLEVVEAVSRGRHDHTNFNKVSPSVTSWLLEHQWPAPTISALQFNHFRLLFHHYCVYLFFFFPTCFFIFLFYFFPFYKGRTKNCTKRLQSNRKVSRQCFLCSDRASGNSPQIGLKDDPESGVLVKEGMVLRCLELHIEYLECWAESHKGKEHYPCFFAQHITVFLPISVLFCRKETEA